MKVFLEKHGKEKEIKFSGNVSGLLEVLGINVSEVLVVRGDEVLLASDKVSDEDSIRLLSVVSGG